MQFIYGLILGLIIGGGFAWLVSRKWGREIEAKLKEEISAMKAFGL